MVWRGRFTKLEYLILNQDFPLHLMVIEIGHQIINSKGHAGDIASRPAEAGD
jgi:hypothetical protein